MELNRVTVFYAGVAGSMRRELMVNGGRVLCLTALGDSLHWAHETATHAAHGFTWSGAQMRNDIGHEYVL
jgi:phosphoribosylamine--glycine ligase